MTCEKSSRLARTVATNLSEELKKYEEPNPLYELKTTLMMGGVPTSYRVLRALAVTSKLIRDVTTERNPKS